MSLICEETLEKLQLYYVRKFDKPIQATTSDSAHYTPVTRTVFLSIDKTTNNNQENMKLTDQQVVQAKLLPVS